jgi:hypothetical protein
MASAVRHHGKGIGLNPDNLAIVFAVASTTGAESSGTGNTPLPQFLYVASLHTQDVKKPGLFRVPAHYYSFEPKFVIGIWKQ